MKELKDEEIVVLAYYLYKLHLRMKKKNENQAVLQFKNYKFIINAEVVEDEN